MQSSARWQGTVIMSLLFGTMAGFISKEWYFDEREQYSTPSFIIGSSTAALTMIGYLVSYRFTGHWVGRLGFAVLSIIGLLVSVGMVAVVVRWILS